MDYSTASSETPAKLNICSCCFESGCFKDISAEYYVNGRKEVYEDMLRDTFNVQIHHEHRTRSSGYICEECIVILKQSADFKRMVKQNQEHFLKALDKLLCDVKDKENGNVGSIETIVIKEEIPIEFGSYFEDSNGERAADDFDEEDDKSLTKVKSEMLKERAMGVNVEESRLEMSLEDPYREKRLKTLERRGKAPMLRRNSLSIISNSTVCIFQWNKSRYRCFCCKEPFNEIDSLREHTNAKHNLKSIEKRIISRQNCLVKVEISNLSCKICNEEFSDLATLKQHLSGEHKVLSSDEDLLVPFKIQNGVLECQICAESFSVFRLLNMHMNKHFQNEVCHICGAGFSNSMFLNLHKTRMHRPLHCKDCDIVFTTKTEKRTHEGKVHGVKQVRKRRFPCPHCSERFYQENIRVLHLVEKHGMARPKYDCNSCRKSFVTRSLLNNHVRSVHMKEKNYKCDICNHQFYNKSDLTRHSVTHTGEKNFHCATCSNNFATKDSLRRHIKRMHVF